MRIDGWERRLDAAMEQHLTLAWRAGRIECLTLVGVVVEEITGRDVIARWRGPRGGLAWTSTAGALRAVREAGGMLRAARAIAAEHGFPQIPVIAAAPGDVGWIDDGNDRGLAVRWRGAWWSFAPGAAAMVRVPDGRIGAAWRVM